MSNIKCDELDCRKVNIAGNKVVSDGSKLILNSKEVVQTTSTIKENVDTNLLTLPSWKIYQDSTTGNIVIKHQG